MSIGIILKVVALVLWAIAAFWRRFGPNAANYDLVAAGLFFWFVGEVLSL